MNKNSFFSLFSLSLFLKFEISNPTGSIQSFTEAKTCTKMQCLQMSFFSQILSIEWVFFYSLMNYNEVFVMFVSW